MKKISIIITIIILSIGFSFGQSVDTLKLYSINELRNDVDSLTKYIEETHPNAFYKFPKDNFYKEADSIKSVIIKPLTIFDFYFLVSPLVAKLEDGHTSIQPPIFEYMKTNPCILPYKFKFSVNEPYIVFDRAAKTITSQIPDSAEILSINGIESKRIINDLINMNSGESKSFRLVRDKDYFFFYLNGLYGINSNYAVTYKFKNKLETKNIPCITVDLLNQKQKLDTSIKKVNKPKNYSISLNKENKTATINFLSFEDMGAFKLFMDSSFQQIKENKIENLIIDIRNNGGGNSDIGDEFFQYISHKNFKQFAKSKIKYSRLQKESYKNWFIKTQDSSWLETTTKPNGLIEEFNDSKLIKLCKNQLRFNGNVFLLTSTYTFSSAASFAQCFKFYKMGKIIGEETGGLLVCYGDVINATLPATKLNLSISHKMFYETGATENDFHGTIPDITVPSEKALDYTIELISKKQKK
jgi:hypothetical protein